MKIRTVLVTLAVVCLTTTAAFAQAVHATATAPMKLRAQAQFELLPIGRTKVSVGDESMSVSNATAYAIAAAFDFSASKYVTLGFAPRMILNVNAEDNDGGDSKELDLRLRLLGHVPLGHQFEAYGYVAPGYAVVMPSDDSESAKGVSIAAAAGLTYDVSPTVFFNGEVGYQYAPTHSHLAILNQRIPFDADFSYLHVGIGAGTRF
jgi:opacity protein-like surface antigen